MFPDTGRVPSHGPCSQPRAVFPATGRGPMLHLAAAEGRAKINAGRESPGLTDTIGSHPFSQDFRNRDASVGLLAVFEKGNEGS